MEGGNKIKSVYLGTTKIYPGAKLTEVRLDFNSSDEITEKGFTFGFSERNGIGCSGGYLMTNCCTNDSGGSILYDVSNFDEYTIQARIYMEGTSRGGDQHFAMFGGAFSDFGSTRDWNTPGHHFSMTMAGGYTHISGIGTGTSQGDEYGTYFTGWYVYEIKYNSGEHNNGIYTMTRYNDTEEVTEESTYTHRKEYSNLGRAAQLAIWLRYGYSSQNTNKVDWVKIQGKQFL